ncbi:hypothetical protein ACFYOK_35950 [Microbispora bryophytorum]|uniref:helix-turn-helix transcriptional regulator n=1 Tax=Microbispora bryophytorum TaxID=1460882 RepID=UPI0033E705C9
MAGNSGNQEAAIPTIGQVVGRNLAELRAQWGQTQKEAAAVLQAHGLAWTSANIASIESGRRESIDLGALTLLAEAYDAPLSRFFVGGGQMRLSAEVTVELAVYREWLEGTGRLKVTRPTSATQRWVNAAAAEAVHLQADTELAARLGLNPDDVSAAARTLWGRSLHQERDRRLAAIGEMTATQRRTHRGHITRQLVKELEPHLPGARS